MTKEAMKEARKERQAKRNMEVYEVLRELVDDAMYLNNGVWTVTNHYMDKALKALNRKD